MPSSPTKSERLALGRLVATPNALNHVPADEIAAALQRHISKDWGEVDEEDRKENDRALRCGFRILSAYVSRAGVRFWIITEADRSSTCVLLPADY